jgi:type IV secretion system protein VirB10
MSKPIDEPNQDLDRPAEAAAKGEDGNAAEREALLAKRRARQAGASRMNAKLVLPLALVAVGGVIFMAVGPRALGKMFAGDDSAQKTSEVSLKVAKESDQPVRLDFVVPGKPEPEKVDPNVAWSEKFKALQDKLALLERSKQDASAAEIQKVLDSYSKNMNAKFEQERKTMADENAQLRAQAQRAEEQKRQAEEAAKRQAAEFEKDQKIGQLQRESKAVIVDQGERYAAMDPTAGRQGGVLPGDQNANERFLRTAAATVTQTSVSQRIGDPSKTVVQGTIISAVLETAIDSQLPGNLRAQVTEPVYSFDGTRVLMAPGTILIGQFDNNVDVAQERILIAWNRAITPEGNSIALGSTGTDTLGRAGTLGNVDNRYGTKFAAAALSSIITGLPNLMGGGVSASVGPSGGTISQSGSGNTVSAGNQLAGGVGGAAGGQASSMTEKYLSLPPVLRVPQGQEIRVFTNRDLVFR